MLAALVLRVRLRRCTRVGRDVRLLGRVHVHGAGEIRLGDRVVLDGARAPIELFARDGGVIEIEDDAFIGAGTSIEARQSVRIGRGARLAEFCKVMDNHFHRAGGDRFEELPSTPVVVGEGAELGPRVIVLPGGRVGAGARVLAASVVTRPIPDRATASGVPARARAS